MLNSYQTYEEIIGGMYDAIEDLDVAGYRWDPSDLWKRSRGPLFNGQPAHHLEFWVDLGGITSKERSYDVHTSSVGFACRWSQEHDPKSQAIAHAARRSIEDFLRCWSSPHDVRTRIQAAAITVMADYIFIKISFETRIPRS